MTKNHFHFENHWNVAATLPRVFERLSDIGAFCDWWPGFDSSATRTPASLVGREARMAIRGMLPFPLRFEIVIVSAVQNAELRARARGDLAGDARMVFRKRQSFTQVAFDWNVRLEQRWLRPFSSVFRPLFVLSHDLAMWRGERGLNAYFSSRPLTR